jgi:hypothetical protein
MPTRRQFITTGIIGGALLAGAYALRKPLDRVGKRGLVESFPLEASLRLVIAAVAPAILAGALPVAGDERRAAIDRATDAVAFTVGKLSATAQREVAELFALLAMPAGRIVAAGVRAPWPEATDSDVRGFLDGWRHSRFDLMKSGYLALHDLVLGAWYADGGTWAAIGYPGPPEWPG